LWESQGYNPCANFVGVYFIFSESGKLLYVGKASAHNSIGKRLNTYFITNPNNKFQYSIRYEWTEKPYYIAAIGIQKTIIMKQVQKRIPELSWIASALEEYLIDHLHHEIGLPDNSIGK